MKAKWRKKIALKIKKGQFPEKKTSYCAEIKLKVDNAPRMRK